MEEKHPIESLMITSMTSIESMVDVNTIIGESIVAPDGSVIIPLSKVCFGFAAGGSEFNTNKIGKFSENTKLPFGGGSGAGVHISPVGFLVAVDMIPDLINKIDGIINKKMDKEAKEKETIQPEVSPDDME